MTPHPIAVGDIHGRLDLLERVIAAYPDRHFVFLGDYVDRGGDSPGVVARVREMVEQGRAVALMGNHDLWMIQVLLGGADMTPWLMNGGQQTLDAYRERDMDPREDARWMSDHLLRWHKHRGVLYSHAMRPDPTGKDQEAHLWGRPVGRDTPFYPLPASLTHSVHGHTPMQQCPMALGLDDGTVAWFIDTGACFTGKLCALDTRRWLPRTFTMEEGKG